MKFAALGLLLSITAMVVIGIIMLFSTGSFSRDAYKIIKIPAQTAASEKGSAAPAKADAKAAAQAKNAADDDGDADEAEVPTLPQKQIVWDPASLVRRQAMWLGIGLVLCVVVTLVDYRFWQKSWPVWFGLAVVLLALCFAFPKINGSHRWLRFGSVSFQPSEVGKIAAITFLAAWFQKYQEQARDFRRGILYPLAIISVILGLIAREIDLGTTSILFGTAFVMIFVAGARKRYLFPLPVIAIAGIISIALFIPERLKRLCAFMDLEKYQQGGGYQQWNGLIALGSGGIEGLGLGMGRQKFSYLPEAHTDFIFPTIGEELGLTFTLLIVFCYVLMIICGIAISLNARDRFGMLLGVGITVILALQAAMNIGVTTAVLPNKGIPLPFISYGGSNLLFCLVCVGILLNIYRNGGSEQVVRAVTRPRPLMTPRI
jgi:cell division protein FtsW